MSACIMKHPRFLSDAGSRKPIYDGIGIDLSPSLALIPGIAAELSLSFAPIANFGFISVVMLSSGHIPMLFGIFDHF